VVADASPPPDRVQDGLVWYGLRSFGAGEPRVELRKEPIPWIPALLLLGAVGVAIGISAIRRRLSGASPAPAGGQGRGPPDPRSTRELEDRILALLGERGGSLFQSEIVDRLGLPKSTVSEVVNRLHEAGRIEKVRKGRENLIRLV
jgi:hypothetical protein